MTAHIWTDDDVAKVGFTAILWSATRHETGKESRALRATLRAWHPTWIRFLDACATTPVGSRARVMARRHLHAATEALPKGTRR